jgi:hypothetical protein
LKMVEAGFDEVCKAGLVERKAGSDEIDVKTGDASGADQNEDVRAGEWLATGEVGLQDAKGGGFLENARPVGGRKLAGARLEFERVGAINTMKGAAMGQLCDQSERIGNGRVHLFGARSSRIPE